MWPFWFHQALRGVFQLTLQFVSAPLATQGLLRSLKFRCLFAKQAALRGSWDRTSTSCYALLCNRLPRGWWLLALKRSYFTMLANHSLQILSKSIRSSLLVQANYTPSCKLLLWTFVQCTNSVQITQLAIQTIWHSWPNFWGDKNFRPSCQSTSRKQ